jgi:hypothetical protein
METKIPTKMQVKKLLQANNIAIDAPVDRCTQGMKTFQLYNQQVNDELAMNRALALVFFASYAPYDWEIDPMHNPEWCQKVAPKKEAEALERAKAALSQSEKWAESLGWVIK